jgi:hypothetical protein
MKNKLIFSLIIIGFLCLNLTSALEFDNTKNIINIEKDETIGIGLKTIPYRDIWETYKPIEIKNAFGFGEILFRGAIIEHTESCGTDCYSIIDIHLENDGVLIQDVLWEKQVNGKWSELDFRNYQIWIQNKETTEERDVYETQCNPTGEYNVNGTAETICERIKIGTEFVELPEYRLLNIGEEVEAGNYRIKIEGGKKPQTILDWKIKTQGIVLSEWAEWGSSGSGFSYITLNSPEDTNVSDTPNINFNCSANVVGATLSNISLWSNSTGSWEIEETHFSDSWDNTGYYSLEGSSGGQVPDLTTPQYNLTNNNCVLGTGIINNGFSFNGANAFLGNTYLTNYTDGGSYSLSMWINPDIITGGKIFEWTHPTNSEGALNIDLTSNAILVGVPYVANIMTYPAIEDAFQHVVVTKSGNDYKLYVNGAEVNSSTQAGGVFSNTIKTYIGASRGTSNWYDGIIDEFGIWNRTLSSSEIYFLYNSGAGLAFNSTDAIFSETITSGIIWNCQGCDSDGDCGFAPSNYSLFIDATAPTININSGNGTQNYGNLLTNHTINYTITDSNLDSCWLEYNGTNRTIPCTSGAMNTTNFALQLGLYEATIYANDTAGNLGSESFEWDYKVFENNRSYNSSIYETAYEGYSINLTATSSLTAVNLIYNGTSHSMTNYGSGIWRYFRDIPSSSLGNNSINFSFVYSGNGIVSNYLTYQNVSAINFAICTPALSTKFLNISFKDEESLSSINASIPNSIFTYYLGSGTETKSYSFSTASNSSNYTFCATPTDKTFHISPYVQYSSTGYPQRTWNPEVTNYNSTLTNQVLYLLGSVDGIYVTYQVTNVADQVLSNVDVYAIRNVFGTNVTIGTGTTGADGTVTFWMNPDFYHYVYFSKTGFQDYSLYHIPTQSSYTIQMGSSSDTEDTDYIKGITYWILPSNKTLFNNTAYTFAFNISSSFWEVSSFGFNLRLLNGTVLDSDSSSTLESPAEVSFNTEDYKRIYMDYYWLINGTYINGTIYWNVMNSENTEWSIKYFFDDLNGILDTGLFGIDDFGKKLIIFLILFFSVGIVGYKFGATSPLTISAITFAIIFFFDVAVDIIPDVGGINNLLTYLSALILVILIFREVQT